MGDRVILHSDINCCYASIEHLHHPELAGNVCQNGVPTADIDGEHGIRQCIGNDALKFD